MVANEPTADEHALRRCIRELTALSTLSAVWSRSDVQEVADGLAVVLFRALPVAIVYVQAYGMDGTAVEVVHTPQGLVSTEQASEIGKALGAPQKPCGSEATPTIANPVGDGMVRLVIIPLGYEGECGVLVAGSQEPDFPCDTDRLLLSVAANQAAIVLQQKRSDEQLRRSERELADFFDNATVGLHWVGPDGSILRANRAELDLLGYSTDEYLGHHIAEFHADQDVIQSILRRLRAGEELRGYEARMRCKDGSIKHVLIDSNVLWHDGEFVHTRCITRDITDLVHTRHAMAESEARFRQLADSMPQVVWTARADGGVDYFNERWYEFTGFPRDQFSQSSWERILHPDDVQRWNDMYFASTQSGAPFQIECRFRGRSAGGYRWFMVRAVPVFDERGTVAKWFGTCTDIDDVKQLQEELREANRLKDEFLATLSHELRTPLNAMLGWSQMLRSGRMQPDVQKRALESLERNARAQAQLVEDLLDVSRIISGKLAIKSQAVDLGTVIAAAVDVVRPGASAKRIRLHVLVDPNSELLVTGDPDRLQQVVWNLLANAVKFTPADGRIDVHLRRSGSRAEIAVEDTGQGIDSAFLPHVFERFSQADSSTARKQGGLGLGLTIVRHLVEAHGGTVRAESAGIGQGATFTVRLPIRAVAQQSVPESASSAPAEGIMLAGTRVLVVDDEADACELIRYVLEMRGAQVTTATSAGEALHLFRRQPESGRHSFDALIADIGMPEQDGYSLIRAVRSLPDAYGGRIPAIAVTAYASLLEREEALKAGYNWHLAKPVEPEQLVAVLWEATSPDSHISSADGEGRTGQVPAA